MKSFIAAFIGYFFSTFFPVMSQGITGTLTVYGEAMQNVRPDEVVAGIHMESIEMDYEQTVDLLGKKSDQLLKALKTLNFSQEDLKTTQFNVSKNYVYSNGIRKDSGYVATQILQLKFPYEAESLIELINVVSGSPIDPQLSFSFQLSGEKMLQVKENLITEAVKDAYRKANIITNASATDIQGIKEIKYGNLTGPEPPSYRMMEKAAADEPAYGGFNVQDLTFSESIEITYFIK
jgi:uncharacterized protein YggE